MKLRLPSQHSLLDGEHVAKSGLAHGVGRPLPPHVADPEDGVGSPYLHPAEGRLGRLW